jgi:hypothetical protein
MEFLTQQALIELNEKYVTSTLPRPTSAAELEADLQAVGGLANTDWLVMDCEVHPDGEKAKVAWPLAWGQNAQYEVSTLCIPRSRGRMGWESPYYETMVFSRLEDGERGDEVYCVRNCTLDKAIQQHYTSLVQWFAGLGGPTDED